jgi:molybdate transport system regulatory protein
MDTMSEIVKKLPGDAYAELIRARFWLVSPTAEGYLGIGRIKLLENIQRYGSINRAAKEMGMSYKKAWKLIEDMNQLAETPLVISEKGGKSGGGTRVTELGLRYIAYFRDLEQRLTEFLQQESECLSKILVQ